MAGRWRGGNAVVCLAGNAGLMKPHPSKKKAGKPVSARAVLKKILRRKPVPIMNGNAGVVAALLEERRNSR